MTNGLARASVRFRPAAFAGTLIALLLGAAVITACGILLQTGLTAKLPPVRYADTPVVIAADPDVRMTVRDGQNTETVTQSVPERARLDAALAGRIAGLPGVAAARPDSAFPCRPAATTPR